MRNMKEFTKKEIFENLMSLNKSVGDVDEMAQPEEAKYRPIVYFNGQYHIGWLKELCVPGKRQKIRPDAKLVGWLLGDKNPVLFNKDQDVQEFFRENADVVRFLMEKYGKGKTKWVQKGLPACQPFRGKSEKPEFLDIPGQEGGDEDVEYGYESSGKMSLSTKLKRDVNQIIYDEFDGDTLKGEMFNEILNERSIPPLMPRFREFVDNHTQKEWTNDSIYFRTLSYNSYKSKEDFLQSVFQRVTGQYGSEEDKNRMKTHYLARQFNNNYSRWDQGRKLIKHYEGKTPIYNLDRRGYEELNLDVSIRMEFEIIGRRDGTNFTWTIRMKNKFGDKLPTDYYYPGRFRDVDYKVSFAPNSLLDDKSISSTKTVNVSDKSFDEQDRITEDPRVLETLKDAIEDFKAQVESIKPKAALKFASMEERDIERNDTLREEQIKKIVQDIIKNT